MKCPNCKDRDLVKKEPAKGREHLVEMECVREFKSKKLVAGCGYLNVALAKAPTPAE